jgi:hypothetical protein
MKIKILHSAPGYGYFGGEIADVPENQAADLIVHGYAIMIPDTVQTIEHIEAIVRKEEAIKKAVRRK